jgi:predicted GNAT family acetyltransferase
MAPCQGPTRNGIRVSYVFTPRPLRGKGYGTAIITALSQHLLDQGRRFCFLFADLDNPTSNSIYQKVGYQPVCDFHMVVWE